MGVPSFFAWLMRKYRKNNIITHDLPENTIVNSLFIDANCLFHPQCFKVLGHLTKWKSKASLEKKMITRILNYIDFLINFTNPKNVMISVDGVAPVAKMSQQRKRRFRSLDDLRFFNDVKKRHNRSIPKKWSNIVITPGTVFMEKLHKKILGYIKTRKDIRIRYSSYHTPGEGEHKILKYVKNAAKKSKTKDDAYLIYGLDADLIFLSIASQKSNIYLLREHDYLNNSKVKRDVGDIETDVKEELRYVSIDEIKNLFFETLKESSKHIIEENKDKLNSFLNDFVVICYFLGNDFLPHIPSVNIQVGGLDMVIKSYVHTYDKYQKNLFNLNKLEINTYFLESFLEYIANREDYYFKIFLPKYKEKQQERRCSYSDPYDREMWEIDNMKTFEIHDPIQLGLDNSVDWKFRYYHHHFSSELNQEKHVTNICKEYLRGVMWNLKYYFKECPAWGWYYPYIHAPFISDLYQCIKNKEIDMNNQLFDKGSPLKPCSQLLAVLPPECSNILPSTYKYLTSSFESPIIDLYPVKVFLDMIDVDKYWKCLPLIPSVNTKRITDAVKDLDLTKEEQTRNEVLGEFKNY